jgi:pimeloyl-ACP methyl ester carboxylesterase
MIFGSSQSMSTPPQQRLHHLVIDGVGVAVASIQSSPAPAMTLAWIHGLGGASTVQFAPAAQHPALASVTSLLIDLPGFGRSSHPGDWDYRMESHAAIVLEVVSRIAEGPVALFGHSMGGSVAILCAERAPTSFRQLIVAEPNRKVGGGPTSAHIAAQSEADYVRHGHEALLRATRLQAATGDPETVDWLEAVQLASPLAMHRSAVSLVAGRSPSFGEIFDTLTLPRALIVGASSGYDGGASHIPPLVVPNAGHTMTAGNPEGFVTALVAALDLPAAPRFC